jgi:hypothetical protein
VRGLVSAVLFLLVLVYGGYTAIVALQQYFELSNLLEEVVQRELPKVSGWGWRPADRGRRIHDSIVRTAKQSGIPVEPDAVMLNEQGGVLAVRITYRFPALKYGRNQAITVPISAGRTFTVPGGP